MAKGTCAALAAVVDEARRIGFRFALVHRSALVGWNLDNDAFLSTADLVLFDCSAFTALGCALPERVGTYGETAIADIPVRLWSRESLGIRGAVDVVECIGYGCEALAPEVVLRKLPYSPEVHLLSEQRARLAAILAADCLTDEEISLYARYVRGE